jgi:hypothetical protein
MDGRWLAKERFRDSLLINNKFNSFWDVYKKGLVAFFLLKGGLLLIRHTRRLSDMQFTLPVLAITLNYLLSWIAASILAAVLAVLTVCCRPRIKNCLAGLVHVLHVVDSLSNSSSNMLWPLS